MFAWAGVCNTLVQQVIATALERRPADRTVRILEVGCGRVDHRVGAA